MNAIVKILVERDRLELQQAINEVEHCKQLVADGVDPEDILYNHFGLEADYIFDLL